MVGHAALGKIIGTNLLGTVSRTDLASSGLGLGVVGLLALDIVQLGTQQCECLRLVLQLGLLGLAVHHDSGGVMSQTHRGVGGIDTLSTVTGRTHDIDTDILLVDLYVHFLCLRHDCYGNGGSVNSSAGLGLGHTLYTMYAGLVFHHGVRALAVDHKGHALHTADADLVGLHQLHLPAAALRVMHIHPVDLSREQGSLVSACARADLYDNVLVIVGVLGQKQNLQCVLQLLDAGLCVVQLFFEHLAHFLIVLFLEHHETLFHGFFAFFVFLVSIDDGLQIALFLHQLPETLLVTDHVRLVQLVHDILVTQKQVVQLVKHACSSIKTLYL